MHSSGILLYRWVGGEPQVLLVHPGGPFWARKDAGAWSIPKGLCAPDEDPLAAARREFAEETGLSPPGSPIALGVFRQPGGKQVHAWALEGDFDPARLRSNTFTLPWPPRSGRIATFPEVDCAAWFAPAEAREKIVKGQRPIIEAFCNEIAARRA